MEKSCIESRTTNQGIELLLNAKRDTQTLAHHTDYARRTSSGPKNSQTVLRGRVSLEENCVMLVLYNKV